MSAGFLYTDTYNRSLDGEHDLDLAFQIIVSLFPFFPSFWYLAMCLWRLAELGVLNVVSIEKLLQILKMLHCFYFCIFLFYDD